jgi:eukaryotic-like serine/threonine-protein kinase
MAEYRELQSLGVGGFGEVFACVRAGDGAPFALKRLNRDQEEGIVARFRREVQLLSSLDHPNVVKIVDTQLDADPLAYVMPLYRTTLEKELAGIAGDPDRVARIFTSILDAVEYAHAEGVIHRDLKPANVLMNDDRDLVVSDFGLGKKLDSRTVLTSSRMAGGSLHYAAPEQWDDLKTVGAGADVYALGRILFRLYNGSLTSATQDTSPLPAAIAFIVNRCTQADPAKRFPSVTALKLAFVSLTDAGQPQGELQELLALRAKLSIPADHASGDLDRFVQLLATYHEKEEDLLHQTLMAVSGDVVSRLLELHPDMMRNLLDRFAADAAGRSWAFSYTDKIARQCQQIFNATSDAEVRASLAVAVGLVGVGHNRWFVIATARELLEGKKTPVERLALAARLESLDESVRRQLGTVLKAIELDSQLLPLLKPQPLDAKA